MGSRMYALVENLPRDFEAEQLEDAQRQVAWEEGLERARPLDFTLPTQFAMAFFWAAIFGRDDRVRMWIIRNLPGSGVYVGSEDYTTLAYSIGTLDQVLGKNWQNLLDDCEMQTDAEEWTFPYATLARARAEASLRDLASAHQRGEEIIGASYITYASNPGPVIRWLNGLIISDPGLLARIDSWSWDDAEDGARLWHAAAVEAGDASPAGGVA